MVCCNQARKFIHKRARFLPITLVLVHKTCNQSSNVRSGIYPAFQPHLPVGGSCLHSVSLAIDLYQEKAALPVATGQPENLPAAVLFGSWYLLCLCWLRTWWCKQYLESIPISRTHLVSYDRFNYDGKRSTVKGCQLSWLKLKGINNFDNHFKSDWYVM